MTEKILGWPEPTEVGGHMVKRSNGDMDDRKAVFTCVDCGKQETGGIFGFKVGIDGCKARPESFNHLSIEGEYQRNGAPDDPAMIARVQWTGQTDRAGLVTENWRAVDGSETVCATFTFKGAPYELHYNQPGPHGAHHIHAVKIEED